MFIEITSKRYSESFIKLVEPLDKGIRNLFVKINSDNIPSGVPGFYWNRGFQAEDSLNPVKFEVDEENYGEIPAGSLIKKTRWERESRLRKISYPDFIFRYIKDYDTTPQKEIDRIRKECKKRFNIQTYGVADSIDQIRETFKFLERSDRKFICFVSAVYKKDQSATGGWRWHKWGPYIGNHKIRCEYLYDEVGIDHVLLYHIYEVKSSEADYSKKYQYKMTRKKHGIVLNQQDEIVAEIGYNDEGQMYVGHWSNHIFVIPDELVEHYKAFDQIQIIFDYIDDTLKV